MKAGLRLAVSSSVAEQVRDHLARCDDGFTPSLSSRVDIAEYARKLHERSSRFEAWEGDSLVGLVAIYLDSSTGTAHISNVSVESRHAGKGLGSRLLADAIGFARERHIVQISLEVARDAAAAIRLYARHGFEACGSGDPILKMRLCVREHRA